MRKTYYNEFDPFAAAWLKELIKNKQIPDGDIDERSITEVQTSDLDGYTQCHFFAGIGGWPLALKQANWGERPVWTGSCPCQPFSSAGQQKGFEDERHLWPAFSALISQCEPPIIFGEQVATAISKGWLDVVFGDLERENYACGAVVFGAHSVGGPHIRQRLYWLADREYGRSISYERSQRDGQFIGRSGQDGARRSSFRLADNPSKRLEGAAGSRLREQENDKLNEGKTDGEERQAVRRSSDGSTFSRRHRKSPPDGQDFWKGWEWISFRDSKRRPIEPGTFPLVNGFPNRMGLLRGFGNALCVPSAKAFIEAYEDVKNGAK